MAKVLDYLGATVDGTTYLKMISIKFQIRGIAYISKRNTEVFLLAMEFLIL